MKTRKQRLDDIRLELIKYAIKKHDLLNYEVSAVFNLTDGRVSQILKVDTKKK